MPRIETLEEYKQIFTLLQASEIISFYRGKIKVCVGPKYI